MTHPEPTHTPIQRIVVALDASGHSLAALESAAQLAGRLQAELKGIFVEDINLLRVAELPFAREFSMYSPRVRPMQLVELERQFRAQAHQMRRRMAEIAQREKISWDFEVRRGPVPAEVLAAGQGADLMILGKAGRSMAGPRYTGSTVRALILHRRGMTLILQQGARLSVPVVVLYDGSPESRKALVAAAHLVEAAEVRLSVIILARDPEAGRRLESDVLEQLAPHGRGADFRLLINPDLARVIRMVTRESPGPLVLPCGEEGITGEALCAIMNEVSNPVLLVR